MSSAQNLPTSTTENVFLLKAFKAFKHIEQGVSIEEETHNTKAESSGNSKELHQDAGTKNHLEEELVSRKLATNSLTLSTNTDKVVCINIDDYKKDGKIIPLVSSETEGLFHKISLCYNEVFPSAKTENSALSSEKVYELFHGILAGLCDDYERCHYSRYFIKLSNNLLQFKSDIELVRDETWAYVSQLFNQNYKNSITHLSEQNVISNANKKTINGNILNDIDNNIVNDIVNDDDIGGDIDNDDLMVDRDVRNKHVHNSHLTNKGFFTTPTSPSWINNFLVQNDDGNIGGNDFMLENEYLINSNNKFLDKKRNSIASSNGFTDSHNPPPPSIAGSSVLDLPNSNMLMDSDAVNKIESSLLNFQQQNLFNFTGKDMDLATSAIDFENKTRHNSLLKAPGNFDSLADEDAAEESLNFNHMGPLGTNGLKKTSKRNQRRFTSSASGTNLVADKLPIKNSIYKQQIENLKKIGNRSATLFKGQLAHQQNYDHHQLQYDSLFKNIKNNTTFPQNDPNFAKYDADVEKQIKEQIMSNAALNSLYDDNTNFARFNDMLPQPEETYLNGNLEEEAYYTLGRNQQEKTSKDAFEKLYTSPVQLKSQNTITTIPEDATASLMNYQSFAKNNKSLSSGCSSTRSGRPAGKNNKFHFVTKKQLQQKTAKVPTASPVDISKMSGNNIINNSNYNSVMSYLNHLNSTGNRLSNISTDYGIPQGLQTGGFPNSNYYTATNLNSNAAAIKELEDELGEKNKQISDLTGQLEAMKDEISWLRKVVMKEMSAIRNTPERQQMEHSQNTSSSENAGKPSTDEICESGKPGEKNMLHLTSSTTPTSPKPGKTSETTGLKASDERTNRTGNKTDGDEAFGKQEPEDQNVPHGIKPRKFRFDFKIKKGGRLAA